MATVYDIDYHVSARGARPSTDQPIQRLPLEATTQAALMQRFDGRLCRLFHRWNEWPMSGDHLGTAGGSELVTLLP